MNGRSVAEHEGARVFDLVPGLQESAEPLLRDVLETGRPLRDVEIAGWTDADPDVKRTWLESFFPVRVPSGAILGVAAVARDVTEVRRLQRELDATLERQHTALQNLQSGLLPVLPDLPGVLLRARYLTASRDVHLGGDWYDAIEAPDGRLVVCVGDVVGHGLPAVGQMAQASGAVRAYVCDGYGPGDVLTRLDRLLDSTGALATAVVAFLDRATGVLEYASAGHPPPLLRRPDGTVDRLTGARGRMLGAAAPGTPVSTATVQVPPGSALVLYTDGLVERRGEDLDTGVGRLVAAMGDLVDGGPGALADRVLEHCLGPVLDDDVCVLVLTRVPG
jgi:serine phosphatase RsbU (regulator of sigma subunit)